MIFKSMQQIARELSGQVDSLFRQVRAANADLMAGYGRELAQRQEIVRLKQELETLHGTARSRFESLQSTEAKCQELAAQLAAMKQERDDIQLRLHAVDHAYAQMSTAEGSQVAFLLRENEIALDTIRRQRQFIRTLYTSRVKKKAKKAPEAKGTPCSCLKSHPVSVSTQDGAVIACRKCFGIPK